jgi:hypothetical protein
MRIVPILAAVALSVSALPAVANTVELTVHTQQPTKKIELGLYGQFLEHIFNSVNGGLWGDQVLNGTLEARDVKSGELLWEYQVDASKENRGWVLAADRSFNIPLLYHSSWREAPLVATDREFSIGAVFSSPLVVNGVVYFGSTDGFVYAVE